MASDSQNFIHTYTIIQPDVVPQNVIAAVPYEIVYATGAQTFYFLNATDLNTFQTFTQLLQQPIQGLTQALNLPGDTVSNHQQQTVASKNKETRTASVMSHANVFNAVIRNCIQGTDKNTLVELIWIPHNHSMPRFYYLTKDKLNFFKKKYVAQDEAAQKAIQNEKGGVSGSKLMQKLKDSTTATGTLNLASVPPWDDGLFTNLAKSLGIKEESGPKVFFGNPHDPNNVFTADADSQLLRYTGGASVGLVASIKDRRFSLNAAANSSLVIAKAEVNIANLSLPCEAGYHVVPLFQARNGEWQAFDMGYLRADLNLTLTGFTGASIMGCASIGYKMSDSGKIQVVGTNPGKSGNPDPTKDSSAGIITNATAFVGAQAGCEVGCSLKWQNPEKGHDWDEFASLGVEGDLSAGAGANGGFFIEYNMGSKKFLIHAAAGVTWGLGCSGSINLVVQAETFVSFIQFVYHKIMSGNYSYIGMITNLAFGILIDAFTKSFFQEDEVINILTNESDIVQSWWLGIRHDLFAEIDLTQVFQIVNNINTNSDRLAFTPPELKGRMLYILTDERIPVSIFNQIIKDYGQRSAVGMSAFAQASLTAIESAVLTILSYIQTKADYNNVITHMGLDSTVSNLLQEGEDRLYNNLNTQGFSANRLAEFHVALNDDEKIAIYVSEPPYNLPIKPNQNVLNIRGPTTFIQGY